MSDPGFQPPTPEEEVWLKKLLPGADAASVSPPTSDEQRLLNRITQNLPATDPKTKFVTGEGLPGLIRGGLALKGDTAAEKYRVFKESYPEGEIVRNPKDKELYFRKTQGGPFYKIDPNMFTDPGGWRDLPLDVLEFGAEEGPTILGEILTFGLGRNPAVPIAAAGRAGTALGRILKKATRRPSALGERAGVLENTLRAGAGGVIGETSRQIGQTMGGTQVENISEQAGRVAEMGAYSSLGEIASKPIIKGIKALKGVGVAQLVDRAMPALRAEARFSLPHLTPGQTVVNPVLARWERMGRTISTKMLNGLERQLKAAEKAWATIIKSDADPNDVTRMVNRAVEEAENGIWKRAGVRWRSLDSARTGEQILSGVIKWNKLAKNNVDRLYDIARSAESPTYDISRLKTLADDVRAGVRYSAPPEKIEIGILSELGEPLTKEVAQDKRLGEQLNKAVREVIETIENLNPDLPSVTHASGRIDDATEQLKTLREQLYDIKTPAPGDVVRSEQRDAIKLYNALTQAMRNPITDTADGAKLWAEAAGAAEKRFMKLDKAIIAQVLKTDKKGAASALAASILSIGKQSDLLDLKAVLKVDDFNLIASFAAGRIFDKPALLKTMDKDVLSTLFRKTDLENITAVADDLGRIKGLGTDIAKAFADNITPRKGMAQFLLAATPRQMDEFIESVRLQPESIDVIRRTILDGIAENSLVDETFDPKRFVAIYSKLDDAGLFRKGKLWADDQLEGIKDLRRYIELSSGVSKADAGTSLMAAEAVSPISVISQGAQALPNFLHKITLLGGFGQMLTSSWFSKLVRGRYRRRPGPGKADWDSAFLRGMAATLAANLGRSSEEETE
jgi:hypothetical protein